MLQSLSTEGDFKVKLLSGYEADAREARRLSLKIHYII